MKVQDLIKEVSSKSSSKKTKNKDLFLKTIIALSEDDDYVSTYISEVTKTGEIVTKKDKLAPKFRKIIASAIKRCTTLTMEEAEEAAKSFRLTMDQAHDLMDIIGESIYININDLNKKVQLFRKPEMDVTISAVDVNETVRNNPQDKTKEVVISPRKRAKIDQPIYAFQKTTRIRK